MQSVILAFLAGTFVGMFSFYVSKIMIKAKVPEACHEKCKRIKELNAGNINLEKKVNILVSDNKQILQDRNKLAEEFANKLNGND